MTSTIDSNKLTSTEAIAAGKEYRWKGDGTDGLRSYSYAASNPNWNYTEQSGADSSTGAYTFSDSSTGQPFARRGNLYNWTAATLGSSLIFTSNSDEGKQATDSICPCGWRLPVIGHESARKSFTRLLNTYSIDNSAAGYNRLVSWPLQYLPTGYYNSSGYVGYRTTTGYWWLGVAAEATDGYYFESYSEDFDTQNISSRGQGYARRC